MYTHNMSNGATKQRTHGGTKPYLAAAVHHPTALSNLCITDNDMHMPCLFPFLVNQGSDSYKISCSATRCSAGFYTTTDGLGSVNKPTQDNKHPRLTITNPWTPG
jgi:hypothetical protein